MSTEEQVGPILGDAINVEYLKKTDPNSDDFEQLVNFHSAKISERYPMTLGYNMLYKLVCLWLTQNDLQNWAEAFLESKVIARTITEYFISEGRKKRVKKGKEWVEEFHPNPNFSQKAKDYHNNLNMILGKVTECHINDLSLEFVQLDNKVNPKLFINKIDQL